MNDVKETVGCMFAIALLLLAVAAGLIIGNFFGFAIGMAVTLAVIAVFVLWLAISYYRSENR